MTHFTGSDHENSTQVSWSRHSTEKLAFSSDGMILATIVPSLKDCLDVVRLLDVSTGEELLYLEIPNDTQLEISTQIAFTPDGLLITWTSDGRLRFWDPITGALLHSVLITFGLIENHSLRNRPIKDFFWA